MKSVYNFVVAPIGERYNNKQNIGDSELILNTEIYNHQFVNRLAKVISTPIIGETNIKPGDIVIVHHNVFRRWHDQYGIEKNSRSYFDEKTYIIYQDQIYLYKRDNKWNAPEGFSFVQPVKSTNNLSVDKEKPLVGIIKYSDGTFKEGDLVGFKPGSEYEFVIDEQKLYRVYTKFITIKYEYQGDEEEYNPSWAESS